MPLFHRYALSLFLSAAILLVPTTKALAEPTKTKAEQQPTEALPNKPGKTARRDTPLSIAFEGADSIGSKLSTNIKELMNSSNLFTLTEKDTAKIRIVISTKPEFSQRPGIGSVYTVVWLFSQSDGTLKHYLHHEVGVVTADETAQLAAKIVEQTDNLAIRYEYLLQ